VTVNGVNNTTFGFSAFFANQTGSSNTAVGDAALLANTLGSSNTAVGGSALIANNKAELRALVGQRRATEALIPSATVAASGADSLSR